MVTITINNDFHAHITGDFHDDDELDARLSYTKGKFWFRSMAARYGRWDGKVHLYNKITRVFPVGLLHIVRRYLKLQGIAYTLVDCRSSERLRPARIDPSLGGGITLRPDQIRALNKILGPQDGSYLPETSERGIIHGSTSSGKTEIAISITKSLGMPTTLFLTGRKKLARQTRERFARRLNVAVDDIGFIQGGKWRKGRTGIYIAVVNTLAQPKFAVQRKELFSSCQLLHIDECFPAGTNVDGRPIECLKKGDRVRAYDVTGKRTVISTVTNTFKNETTALVAITTDRGSVYCTPNHPFLTKLGWKAASLLTTSDMVCYNTDQQPLGGVHHAPSTMQSMQKRDREKERQNTSKVPGLPKREQRAQESKATNNVLPMRSPPNFGGAKTVINAQAPSRLLLGSVQKAVLERTILTHHDRYQSTVSRPDCAAHDNEQPYERSSNERKSKKYVTAHRMEAANKRRKRARNTRTTALACKSSWVGNRVCYIDQTKDREWLPHVLQGGHRQLDTQDSSRGRWYVSRCSSTSSTGQEKGGVLEWARVEGVALLKPGSDARFREVCPDGYVYNIEVTNHHTYIANGFVVHNCHHGASDLYYKLISNCRARYRYGLTGTPAGRSDGADLKLRACTGRILARIRSAYLVEKGILARPKIYFTKISKPLLVSAETWGQVYGMGIVNNDYRNGIITQYAHDLDKAGLATLILVKELAHGKGLKERLEALGSKSRFVNGSTTDDMLDRRVGQFEAGTLNILIATSIFDEGVDIPAIRAIIMGTGGQSKISTLQRIGRGLRHKTGDNRVFIFDFFDDTHRFLRDHATKRLETCRAEDHETILLEKPGKISDLIR